MDYVQWCGRVLDCMLDAGRANERVRLHGIEYSRLLGQLFGEVHASEPAPDSVDAKIVPEREAVSGALADLEYLGCVKQFSGQMFRVTAHGRDLARDFTPLWRQICATPLEPEHRALLRAVNQLSERAQRDYSWCAWLGEDDYGTRLTGNVGSAPRTSLDVLIHELTDRYLLASWCPHPLGAVLVRPLKATYVGLVWETKRGETLVADLIDALLADWETASVDFKQELHLDIADDKASFIKDVLALANTPVSGRRWLVIGFHDKTRTYHGPPDPTVTPLRIEEIVDEYTQPYVRVRYEVADYRGQAVGLLEVLPDRRNLPYRVSRGLGDKKRISSGQVFVRHGTRNVVASDEEIRDLDAERHRAMQR